ncbi:heparanase-like protein 3 isoform X2 [Helianthus annuus]|nr:heparanase-like protein 3 isoform X2 [Helianthus annuus]
MGYTQGCLPLSRWDELNTFFQNSRAKVIFGLNALYQREVKTNGAVIGPWNSSDAEALMKYTVDKGFTIHGWELGNELSGRGIGASIGADQYASDMVSLQNLVQKIYKAFEVKPLVLGPGGFFDANWFNEFVNKSKDSLQVITQHIYNLGPGVDNHLVEKILNPSYLDGGSQPFRDVQNILKKSKASTVAWVGEAGGAYNSGHNHVTNSFVFSFWYLDQLGMAASYDTKTYCRQTLIGGNYGLLNTDTYVPNPDYYSALLWHRLMGRRVLSTSFQGTRMIRSYAHCSKRSNGMTILLINLDGITKTEVGVTIENETIAVASKRQIKQTHSSKLRNKEFTREEYHLTAKDGNLNSHTVLLNGKELTVNSTGIIPSLDPVEANLRDPITVAPYSIVFVHIPGIHIQACT